MELNSGMRKLLLSYIKETTGVPIQHLYVSKDRKKYLMILEDGSKIPMGLMSLTSKKKWRDLANFFGEVKPKINKTDWENILRGLRDIVETEHIYLI